MKNFAIIEEKNENKEENKRPTIEWSSCGSDAKDAGGGVSNEPAQRQGFCSAVDKEKREEPCMKEHLLSQTVSLKQNRWQCEDDGDGEGDDAEGDDDNGEDEDVDSV